MAGLCFTSKEDNDGCIIHRIPAQQRVQCHLALLFVFIDVRGPLRAHEFFMGSSALCS